MISFLIDTAHQHPYLCLSLALLLMWLEINATRRWHKKKSIEMAKAAGVWLWECAKPKKHRLYAMLGADCPCHPLWNKKK